MGASEPASGCADKRSVKPKEAAGTASLPFSHHSGPPSAFRNHHTTPCQHLLPAISQQNCKDCHCFTSQLLFPCSFKPSLQVYNKTFIRLKATTAELLMETWSKLYTGLHKLHDVRDLFRLQSAKCFSRALGNQPLYNMKQSSVH